MLSEGLDREADDHEEDDVVTLTRLWLSERNGAELLPFASDVIERTLELVAAQNASVDALATDESDAGFVHSVYSLELERIRFVLRSYMRTRIHKIETHTGALLKNPEYRARMSEDELAYAEQFNRITLENYKKSFLDEACPPSLQTLDDAETANNPNLNQAVFCRVRRDIGPHLLPTGDTINLTKDKIYLLHYRTVKPFVITGEVDLI
ncbi:hypothetical protein BC830DRAFT_1062435 [Chytriomyces sp. MP71]|nr:hypothetical protein BC830DRAFT_1062435 [Chytriomyces sp. MP71]